MTIPQAMKSVINYAISDPLPGCSVVESVMLRDNEVTVYPVLLRVLSYAAGISSE